MNLNTRVVMSKLFYLECFTTEAIFRPGVDSSLFLILLSLDQQSQIVLDSVFLCLLVSLHLLQWLS